MRFVAYDLFLPGSERASPKSALVYQVMADTMVQMRAQLEVRGIALETFSSDQRQRSKKAQDGVTAVRVAARRAVIATQGVRQRRPREIMSRQILPAITPGLSKPAPAGVVNLTEFVFLAREQPAKNPAAK